MLTKDDVDFKFSLGQKVQFSLPQGKGEGWVSEHIFVNGKIMYRIYTADNHYFAYENELSSC